MELRVAGAPTATCPAGDDPPPPAFRLGDDVVHAAFGEGVVTGLEPGGIVVIRFSQSGTERKLVADLAPDLQTLIMFSRRRGSNTVER